MFVSEVSSIKEHHKALLIHGAGMDHHVWAQVQARLGWKNVTSYAVDLPGHGKTGGAPATTISEMADAVAALAEKNKWVNIGVVGHSMGALVALDLAARYKRHFSLAVLLGVGLEMPVNAGLLDKATKTPGDTVDAILKWGFAPDAATSLKEDLKPIMMENSSALGADLAACNNFKSGVELAGKIEIPVHLVIGGLDKMTPPAGAQALLAKLKLGSETLLTQNGHMLPVEAAIEIAAIVSELMEIRSPSR